MYGVLCSIGYNVCVHTHTYHLTYVCVHGTPMHVKWSTIPWKEAFMNGQWLLDLGLVFWVTIYS